MRLRHMAALLIGLALAACAGPDQTAAPAVTSTSSRPTEAAAPTAPTATAPAIGQLTLWVAPIFAPDPDSEAGALLAQRIEGFEALHPGLDVEVRVKAALGPAGLLQSLIAASSAASAALPDLITLNGSEVDQAIALDLLEPPGEQSSLLANEDPYAFALDLLGRQPGNYALPFAGEAQVLAYRIREYASPPASWAALIESGNPILIPTSDPDALTPLALYLGMGGSLMDESGKPMLDPARLAETLELLASAQAAGILHPASSQYPSTAETLRAFLEGRATAAMAPLSTFFSLYDPQSHAALPLPTRAEAGVSLAQPWALAMVQAEGNRVGLRWELLQWLLEPSFLGPWTHALGLLPTTATRLAEWPDGPKASIASRIVGTARCIPDSATLERIAPIMQEALVSVLYEGVTPEAAANTAAQALESP